MALIRLTFAVEVLPFCDATEAKYIHNTGYVLKSKMPNKEVLHSTFAAYPD